MTIKKTKGAVAVEKDNREAPPPLAEMPELKIEYKDIASLVPYARNSKTHTPEQIAKIKLSMADLGFYNPVLVGENNTILAGHARWAAAQELMMPTVPTIDISHLTRKQQRKLIISDNSLATRGAGWNIDNLKYELQDLEFDGVDLADFNLEPDFLKEILEVAEPEPVEESEPVKGPPDVCSKAGDIWLMGLHELRVENEEGCYAIDQCIELFQKLTGRMVVLDGKDKHYFQVRHERLGD